jgi:uncharacterized membrane protein
MQTPASIFRPPVHPLLIVLSVGLWVFSLFCDLLYLGGAEAEIWSRLALYTMVGGFVGAFTAVALPGFVAQMNLSLVVLALYAVNIWLRLGDPHLAMAITLSVIGVGVLAVSSWLGGGTPRVPRVARVRKE